MGGWGGFAGHFKKQASKQGPTGEKNKNIQQGSGQEREKEKTKTAKCKHINKELSPCLQLGTDALPEACRCLSVVGPRGGPHFTACEHACKAVMFFTF